MYLKRNFIYEFSKNNLCIVRRIIMVKFVFRKVCWGICVKNDKYELKNFLYIKYICYCGSCEGCVAGQSLKKSRGSS